MPKIVREDVDNLNAVLTITLEQEDYAPKWEQELQKYRQKSSLKGFRKGKTPKRMLKKMVGKSVLGEIINELIQEELFKYLTKENLNILGQPLPVKGHELIDFDLDSLREYVFKFEVGLTPDFEVQGLTDEPFRKYSVTIPEEQADNELKAARNRFGERTFPEEDIKENDFLKLSAVELAGDEPKEGGVESEFSVLVDTIDNEQVKTEILGKKLGDKLKLNLFTLEKEKDENYVRKYFLNLNDEADKDREVGQEYEVTIVEVSRLQQAELDQTFFDNYFGEGEVSSEAEAREKIKENIQANYNREAEGLLYRDLQDRLMEKNQMTLPDEFLKRWLLEANQNLDAAKVEEEYNGFAKSLRWSLVRNKLLRQFEVSVTQEEIVEGFKNRVRSYFGNSPYANDDLITGMANRLLEDEKQVQQIQDEILDDKLYEKLAAHVTVEDEPIELGAFEEVVRAAREQAMQARRQVSEEEE